jgi:small acid-soluble spore protein F (minor alpha/beta-type SASP)
MGKNRPPLLGTRERDQLKYEVAEELGLSGRIAATGWDNMPTRELGRIGGTIGGTMVRVLVRHAEEAMARSVQGERQE